MITAGSYHKLKIQRIDNTGVWLDGDGSAILLPKKECPQEVAPGMELDVFIYVERQQLLATRKKKRCPGW